MIARIAGQLLLSDSSLFMQTPPYSVLLVLRFSPNQVIPLDAYLIAGLGSRIDEFSSMDWSEIRGPCYLFAVG